MPHNITSKVLAAAAVASLLAAVLALSACGGSSASNATAAANTRTTSTAPGAGGFSAARASRFRAQRECLAKNGINLPQRKPGEGRPPGSGGGFLGGGPQLPAGVTRAQFQAALKKCGGGGFAGRGSRLSSPAYRQALSRFGECLRAHGVKVPAPNTSGSGPVFNTKGIDTASQQFKTAEEACSSILRSAFPRPPAGSAGTPGARVAPGSQPGGQ
jgi:hypothetical protein